MRISKSPLRKRFLRNSKNVSLSEMRRKREAESNERRKTEKELSKKREIEECVSHPDPDIQKTVNGL